MAANKFATMLHRSKTPKIAIILIYTLLEWTLIALLLLNGLFSYLISRFACFFGLKPPCVFCSRVDHVFSRKRESYSDLVCDAHSAEISKLGYCSTHRNLAEASEMCEDCSSSRPTDDRSVAVLSWMKRSEEGEKDLRCSCCDVILESGFFSPYLLLKQSSLGVLEYTQKGKLEDDEDDNLVGEEKVEEIKERESLVVENFDGGLKVVDDESSELITPMGAGNGLLVEEERLVPVELIDSSTLIHGVEDEDDDRRDYVGYNLVEKDDTAVDLGTVSEEEEEKIGLLSTMEVNKPLDFPVVNVVEEECSLVDHQCETHESVLSSERELDAQAEEECAGEEEEKSALLSSTEINKSQDFPLINIVEEELSLIDLQCETHQSVLSSEQELDAQEEAGCADGFGEFQVSEEVIKAIDAEANCEVSIGSEICDHEQIELPHVNELEVPQSVCANEQCSASYNVVIDKEQVTEAEPMAETIARTVDGLSVCTGMNENEDEKLPETPSSIDSLHALHKRFLFERRESGAESLDGSVASEIDGNGILTVDQLKAALRAERKALSALYMELEEERSASAIAANQTMAMITRLQEEKAAMQMEALQYQRMMEEQSEYDQEALQLLNDLMMKREKEKQELEKELELYRKKVIVYEAKERRKEAERNKINGNGTGSSSGSSSASDGDDLSFGSHEGEDSSYSHNESTPNIPINDGLGSVADQEANKHLVSLDESLADFEEERLSILEQLKALEEKLFSMDDNELESVEHKNHSNGNGHAFNGDYELYEDDINGDLLIGFDHNNTNGKLHQKSRTMASGRKRLLPLFDAIIGMENENGIISDHDMTDCSPQSIPKSVTDDQKRLAIAEEVDNVYERLQALEADREFLRHCIRSLKKGDKGMDLLQEILQHLRDLRNVELRVRNTCDALASLSD